MKVLRVIVSAFMVLLGAMVIVAWALSVQTVRSIEDGTAADALTARVLESPQTAELVADGVQRALHREAESRVGEIALVLLDDQIHDAIVALVSSDFVTSTLESGLDRVQNRLLDEVTDPDRPEGPFSLEIDVSTRINERLDDIPVVGALIPSIEVPPYAVEVIDAEVFEDIRGVYKALDFAATWFVWLGLLLIAGGIAVAPRWRWFLPRALIAAGALGLAISFALGALGPGTLASLVPGGRDGGAGILVEDVIADAALSPITSVLLNLGVVALVLAGLFALALRFLPGQRDHEEYDEHDEPAVEAEEAPSPV